MASRVNRRRTIIRMRSTEKCGRQCAQRRSATDNSARTDAAMKLAGATVLLILCVAPAASGKEVAPDQDGPQDTNTNQPLATGKPVTTTTIKRCPDGYELVVRADGRRGCAKDVVPA